MGFGPDKKQEAEAEVAPHALHGGPALLDPPSTTRLSALFRRGGRWASSGDALRHARQRVIKISPRNAPTRLLDRGCCCTLITTAKPLPIASLMARVDLSMPSRCSVPYQCACSTRSFTKLPTFPMSRIHPQIPFSYVFDPTDLPWPWRPVRHRVLRVGAWTALIPRARANAGAVLRLTPPLPPRDLPTQTTRTTRHQLRTAALPHR